MSFGGVGPGLSILTGVAQGVAESDKRKREMEEEAIRRRLQETQIKQSEANTAIMFDRENRYREENERAAQEKIQEREEQAAQAVRDAEAKRAATTQMVAIIMADNPGMGEEEAWTRAATHVEKTFNYSTPRPEPTATPRVPSAADRRFETDEAWKASVQRIQGNPEALDALSRARTMPDASRVAEELGLPSGPAMEVWGQVQRTVEKFQTIEDMPPAMRRTLTDEARNKAEMFINLAVEEGADDVAEVALKHLQDAIEFGMDQQMQGTGFSDYELLMYEEIEKYIEQRARLVTSKPARGQATKDWVSNAVGWVTRGRVGNRPVDPELEAILTPTERR